MPPLPRGSRHRTATRTYVCIHTTTSLATALGVLPALTPTHLPHAQVAETPPSRRRRARGFYTYIQTRACVGERAPAAEAAATKRGNSLKKTALKLRFFFRGWRFFLRDMSRFCILYSEGTGRGNSLKKTALKLGVSGLDFFRGWRVFFKGVAGFYFRVACDPPRARCLDAGRGRGFVLGVCVWTERGDSLKKTALKLRFCFRGRMWFF